MLDFMNNSAFSAIVAVAYSFEKVSTNKHSRVLHRLIGRVMDFTDSSRSEPNTQSPPV